MGAKQLSAVVVSCAWALGGCGNEPSSPESSLDDWLEGLEDEPVAPAPDRDAAETDLWGLDDEPESPPPEPFSRPFEALVPQWVGFGGLEVRVVGARVERGMDEFVAFDGDWTWPAAPEDVYAELDVEVKNRSLRELDIQHDHWDLIDARGERLLLSEWVDLLLAPDDATRVTLRYVLPGESASLAGAQLEINGSRDRDTLEPARIPLDAAYSSPYPIDLMDSLGGLHEPTAAELETAYAAWSFEVREAELTRNAPRQNRRAPRGSAFVRLWVRVTYLVASIGGEYVDEEDVRAVVDGLSIEPASIDADHLTGQGATQEYEVRIPIADDTPRFSLRLRVARGSGEAPDVWREIPVELP